MGAFVFRKHGQWVETVKAAGIRGLIVTAKHHDGFCLWPSRLTEHSVKNSPWKDGKGDVVGEVAEACRKGGLAFGVYLSPWDRREPSYGDSPRYNEHFKNQLRELLTLYGEISEVWFDGACGEGPNGKRQVYDWPGFFALIRELQPGAVISIPGPDARWIGNEAGVTRESEWSVIPVGRLDNLPDEESPGGVAGLDAPAADLGSRVDDRAALVRAAQLAAIPIVEDNPYGDLWFDEAPPHEIWKECQPRILARDGTIAVSMTPTRGMDWIHDRYYKPWEERPAGRPVETDGLLFVMMDLLDNPYVPAHAAKEMIADLVDEDEVAMRRFGKFVQLKGRVFKNFDPRRNTCRPFPIPPTWPKFRGMDWGFGAPAGGLWFAYDPGNRILYAYREFYERELTTPEIASRIVTMSRGEEYDWSVLDPAAGPRRA